MMIWHLLGFTRNRDRFTFSKHVLNYAHKTQSGPIPRPRACYRTFTCMLLPAKYIIWATVVNPRV